MRLLSLAIASVILAPVAARAEQAYTTRIEPRPYYGATVTLEEGVRVFRPLPPHKHVIINPGNRTPVNLSFNESTSRSYNSHYHDYPAPAQAGYGGGGVYGGAAYPYGYGTGGKHGQHPGQRTFQHRPGGGALVGPRSHR